MSDSLQPHELQHTRPPCPSPTPGVHPNPCPSSRWCHSTISSSVIPFSSCPQSFPASGSFPIVSSLHQVAKLLEFQFQHQPFQRTPRTDLLQNGLVGSPCKSSRDSQESSPTPQFKSTNSLVLSFLYSQYMTTGKTIALTRWTFVDKVMSLLFNILSRFVHKAQIIQFFFYMSDFFLPFLPTASFGPPTLGLFLSDKHGLCSPVSGLFLFPLLAILSSQSSVISFLLQ